MLVLSRKQDQEILIGDQIKITILKTRGNTVRLGIEAPRDIKVVRGELEPETEQRDDHEDDGAEFTIVFNSDGETESESADSQCVQFTSTQQLPRTQTRSHKTTNRLPSETESETIRFEGRLPRVLKHNRLKEIVDRIAIDNAGARVTE